MIFWVGLIYLSLFLKVFSSFLGEKFSLFIGKLEYLISPLRDTLLSYVLAGYGLYLLKYSQGIGIVFLIFFLLSQINFFMRQKFRLIFCKWVYAHDNLEPNFFFETYYRGLGSFNYTLPLNPPKVSFSLIDYKKGNTTQQSILPIIRASFDTATLAKLAILAMKKMPGKEGIEAFDTFARIWGARFIALAELKLQTLGIENLEELTGKVLLVFNHKSYLDFTLNFFALGDLRIRGRHLRPRFIAAKDHFIDNPFLYSWIGVGKCIERAGMIFINRQKGKGWLAMKEAADKLCESDVEVAVYPQGTRAWGICDENGSRLDAGYYTTFSKKNPGALRGHIKSGTAQLILDTALRLQKQGKGNLQVLFVGIEGSATAGPKGSFKIQKGSTILFQIGKLWKVELPQNISFENPEGKLPTNEAEQNYVDQLLAIHEQLDHEMERSIGRHTALIKRILKDPRIVRMDAQSLTRIEEFLKRADATENTLPFVVLDRLYALDPKKWERPLKHFAQLAWQNAEKSMWEDFLVKVSKELTQG